MFESHQEGTPTALPPVIAANPEGKAAVTEARPLDRQQLIDCRGQEEKSATQERACRGHGRREEGKPVQLPLRGRGDRGIQRPNQQVPQGKHRGGRGGNVADLPSAVRRRQRAESWERPMGSSLPPSSRSTSAPARRARPAGLQRAARIAMQRHGGGHRATHVDDVPPGQGGKKGEAAGDNQPIPAEDLVERARGRPCCCSSGKVTADWSRW